MVQELHLSAEAGRGFEGDMQRLSGYCRCTACSPSPSPTCAPALQCPTSNLSRCMAGGGRLGGRAAQREPASGPEVHPRAGVAGRSALARALETVGAAGGGAAVEVLRKESLTSLAPAAAARVLAHSYRAVLPIAPLPFPPLPLSPLRPGWPLPLLLLPADSYRCNTPDTSHCREVRTQVPGVMR